MRKREPSRRRGKIRHPFVEDTQITAQTIVNIVTTTADPKPWVAAVLEGYARRVRAMTDEELRGPGGMQPLAERGSDLQA